MADAYVFCLDCCRQITSATFLNSILTPHKHPQLRSINDVEVYGPPPTAKLGRMALATFNVQGIHPTDISAILDQSGVAVRSGHMCTAPLHRELGLPASVRASPYFYNSLAEIDVFIEALKDAISFFR